MLSFSVKAFQKGGETIVSKIGLYVNQLTGTFTNPAQTRHLRHP